MQEIGKKAEANFSHMEAFNFFKKALKIFDKLSDAVEKNNEKLEIHKLIMLPIAMLGYPEGSLRTLEAGVKIATELGDLKSLSRFHHAISNLYIVKGDSLKHIVHSEKSFYEAEKIKDLEFMALLSPSLCYAYVVAGRFDKVVDISLKVTRLIEKTERKSDCFNTLFILYPFLLGARGMAMAMQGDIKKGKMISEKGLKLAIESGHRMTLAFNEHQHAGVFIVKGDGQEAMGHCQNTIKYSEGVEWHTILSQGWTLLGYANCLLGELDCARELISKGIKIQEELGIEAMLSMHYYIFAMVLFELGDLGKALQWSEKALELSIKNNEKRYEGLSKIWIGRILGSKEKAQYREGEQFILEGYGVLKELGLRPAIAQGHLYLGELYRNSGREFRAVEHLRKAKSMFKEMEMDYWTAKCREASKDL